MSTISTEERRDVARRLRGQAKMLGPNMDAPEFAHYTADVIDVNECMTWYEMELRLADLIDPSCDAAAAHTDATATRDVSQGRRSDVDRDALVELADEMTWCYEGAASAEGDGTVGAWVVMQYADRIREACGVER